MHRKPLLRLLNEYTTDLKDEKEMLIKFRQFVKKEEACFEREWFDGHVTSSVWIVNPKMDKTLLTHHAKIDCWLQPGGHCDGEYDVVQTALRELEEETGLKNVALHLGIFDVDVHLIEPYKKDPAHLHYDVRFLVVADELEAITISEESKDLKWFKLSEVKKANPSRSLERMVLKTKALKAKKS